MNREETLDAAGRYVLGEFEGQALRDFETQLARDPELAAAVQRLSLHLAALDDTAAPESVSPALWGRIEGSLDGPARPAVFVGPPAYAPTRLPPAGWMGIAAAIVVSAGIGYFAGTMTATRPEPVVIAVLINEADATPGAIVEAFGDDSVTIVPLQRFTVPEGQILQVWTLPDPETGPVSLGTFSDVQNIHLDGPDLSLPQDGQLYEITLEPAPGSPTGRPTGPVLVKGFAKPPVS